MPITDRSRPTRSLQALAVAGLAALSVAGCGSGGSSNGASTTPAARPGGTAFVKFQACLKQHGVNLPAGRPAGQRPPAGGGQPPPAGGKPPSGSPPSGARRPGAGAPGFPQSNKARKAFAACRGLMPNRPGGAPPGA